MLTIFTKQKNIKICRWRICACIKCEIIIIQRIGWAIVRLRVCLCVLFVLKRVPFAECVYSLAAWLCDAFYFDTCWVRARVCVFRLYETLLNKCITVLIIISKPVFFDNVHILYTHSLTSPVTRTHISTNTCNWNLLSERCVHASNTQFFFFQTLTEKKQ